MSPLMMRIFTLVGIALAVASMQFKARADAPGVGAATFVHRAVIGAVAGNVQP